MSARLVGRLLQRGSPLATRSYSRPTEAILRKNSAFQEDNGVPVYLKSGFGDRAMLIITGVIISTGVVLSYYTLLSMAAGKKK